MTGSRSERDADVLVVGAGPVGLMLAGELRLGGASVVIVERLAEPTGESRASQLNARTMELFDQRGLLDRLDPPEWVGAGHFGGIGGISVADVASALPGFWKIPQFRTEELLTGWALGLGARMHREHELRDFVVDGDGITAEILTPTGTVHMRACYLVGCDGEGSTVRALAGIPFPGKDAGRELLRADVAGIRIPARRFERHQHGLAIAARRPDGVTRVMVHEFGATAVPRTGPPAFAEVVAAWARITGEDIAGGTPLWVDSFGDASRQAARYRQGRVLLAGDAAHVQLPAGGQALNLGLADAVNLGWKLAAQVRGTAPAGLLDSYHDERHPVGERVLANVEAQAILLLGGREVDGARAVLTEVVGLPGAAAHLAAFVSGLDVRYGQGDHPLVGARLPKVPLETWHGTTDTFAVLRRGRGVLLDLTGQNPDGCRALIRDRVDHVVARSTSDTVLDGFGAVLVRPDGHVAWAGAADDLPALATALSTWFGDEEEGVGTVRKLENKTALVTGSSRGIGRATAERLAAEGATVAIHYTSNADAAEQTVKNIVAAGGRAFAIRAELGVPGDVDTVYEALIAGLKEHTGKVELNILVNNAGVMGGVKPDEITPEQFDRLMAVNAKAPLFLIQRLLPIIPDGGRIVNISSGLTRVANPDEIAYAMTKGAIEMISLHYAKHLGPRGITVNSVAPGVTENGNPLFDIPEAREQIAALSVFNRIGQPADVGDVVAFLASDDARWITGAFIDASGGTLVG